MGKAVRRKQIIIVPDDYWTSSFDKIKWISKESECQDN